MSNLTFATVLTIKESHLLAEIKAITTKRSEWNAKLHLAVCAAVARASNPEGGRETALQAIYDNVPKAEQGMLRAWLSIPADTFSVGKDAKPWLKMVDGKFKIAAGAVDYRPTFDAISAVAGNMDMFFLNKTIDKAKQELAFDTVLENYANKIIKIIGENKGEVPAELAALAEQLKNNVVTFKAKRVIAETTAPVVEPAPVEDAPIAKPHRGKRVVRDLTALGAAIGELPQLEAAAA